MIYFAKYQSEFGFMIAVDGFHNVPEKVPYINFCCINPPGALTTKPLDSRQIYVNSNINWESPIMSPQFLEGFFYFKNISVRQNLTIIFEVRAVAYKKSSLTLKTIGWTVLPVFNQSGYVQSGIYQLPIFKGPLPLDTLSYISSQDAWPYLMNLMSMKNSPIQLLEPMGIIVRLLDGQREVSLNLTKINSFRGIFQEDLILKGLIINIFHLLKAISTFTILQLKKS